MKNLILIFGAFISLSCSAPQQANNAYLKLEKQAYISAYEADKANNVLIDVRTPAEYNKGSILNASNMNFFEKNFEDNISKLDTNKTAFIFCQSGGRSQKASKIFLKAGFKKVIDLKGGYGSYKR